MPALVRFPSGLILFSAYQGSSDSCWIVFDSWTDRRAEKHAGKLRCSCGGDEPVEIWTSYGSGFYWKGRACRGCKLITRGGSPWGREKLPGKGDKVRDTITDGSPDWVDEYLRPVQTLSKSLLRKSLLDKPCGPTMWPRRPALLHLKGEVVSSPKGVQPGCQARRAAGRLASRRWAILKRRPAHPYDLRS
jgi:hypothetical protein